MLKEEDPMIELIREWIIKPLDMSSGLHLSTLEVFGVFDRMMLEHVRSPADSDLTRLIPTLKKVFVPLDLTRAAKEYDAKTRFMARKRVPPTFKEIRHVLNLATINAIAGDLKLVTFDADDTIYEDGGTISKSSRMVQIIVGLLHRGLVVSLVTAAGYPGKPERYEARLRGILDALEDLTPDQRARFLVMGGECNYLLETYETGNSGKIGLREIDGKLWKDGRGERWPEEDVSALLDAAEKVLADTTSMLQLPTEILRKERAIGIINTSKKRLSYENLEEICLTLQQQLKGFSVPFCAFNGGNDVWVDIGNKALGIQALQKYVFRFLPKEMQGEELSIIQGTECLHVGDRFTRTGNDTRSREAATTVWVSNPQETAYIMKKLLKKIDYARGLDAASDGVLSPRKATHESREAQIEAAIHAATTATRTS